MAWAAAGEAIINRLGAEVPALAHIGWASDLAGVDDIAALCPGAWVQPGGITRPDALERAAVLAYRWLVTLTVVGDGVVALEVQADGYLDDIRRALIGWRWEGAARPYSALKWTADLEPYYEPGYGEFPIELTMQQVAKGGMP